MTDVLIRDVPDDVLAAIDAKAKRVGLSRSEYLRRALERERAEAPGPVDLLIAATAELADLTVLHVDKDFDLVADVAALRTERLALG